LSGILACRAGDPGHLRVRWNCNDFAAERFPLVAPDPDGYTDSMWRRWAHGLLLAGLAISLVAPASAGKRRGKRAVVEDILATPEGSFVVILKTKSDPARFVPIWVGKNEAMAIRMRMDRRKPPRPLTLNLLESVISTSNIKVVEVRVDALKGGIFLGKLRLKQNGRVWEIDARPSDAIGLAVGSDASIWVAQQVLDDASFGADDLDVSKQKKPRQPEPKSEPKTTDLEETL
jgi:bifunctional DNase/RNase